MRDEDEGGSHHRADPDEYAILRIATWHWRLRLFSGITVGVLVMEGISVALVFAAALGVFGSAELLARRLARRDVARRVERAR